MYQFMLTFIFYDFFFFFMAQQTIISHHSRYWSWNGGPREGRGVEAMEKGGQIVGAGGAGGGWERLG